MSTYSTNDMDVDPPMGVVSHVEEVPRFGAGQLPHTGSEQQMPRAEPAPPSKLFTYCQFNLTC